MICHVKITAGVSTLIFSGITGYTTLERLFYGTTLTEHSQKARLETVAVSGGQASMAYTTRVAETFLVSNPDGTRAFVVSQYHNVNPDAGIDEFIYTYFTDAAHVGYKKQSGVTEFDCYVVDASSAINLSLQNNSTIQQIKYKVGAGAETTLNAGASAQISNLGNGAVLGVNPILSTRPITFNGNGRIASVGYNGVNYTQFPTNINVDVSGTPTITLNGTQAPTVTINYSNTNDPVITNT